MKLKIAPSGWLRREGLRLGARTYVSGAFETKLRLDNLSALTQPLVELTDGYQGGVFRPPIFGMQFSRNLVESDEFGVPFMTSTAMLMADLDGLPLVREEMARSRKFSMLELQEGMTLISCSGTIGRVVYVRKDMAGIWSSQDVIKVQPNPDLVRPGYIFAFLSSKFGIPLLTAGTYGAIIQHIEREHLIDVPIPRFGEPIEESIHDLVARASANRTEAVGLLRDARAALMARWEERTDRHASSGNGVHSTARASDLRARMDAYYFSERCTAASRRFERAEEETRALEEVAEVFIPGIFKRRYAEDSAYGHPYLTGGDVFQFAPSSERYLMKSVAEQYRLVVDQGTILVQEAGQLGGLIGRSVLAGRTLSGAAVSNNMVRIRPRNPDDVGYLYAVLSTEDGVRLISREAAGSSIPHIDAGRVSRIRVPWAPAEFRSEIGEMVVRATQLRDEACDLDSAARSAVEEAIEEST